MSVVRVRNTSGLRKRAKAIHTLERLEAKDYRVHHPSLANIKRMKLAEIKAEEKILREEMKKAKMHHTKLMRKHKAVKAKHAKVKKMKTTRTRRTRAPAIIVA